MKKFAKLAALVLAVMMFACVFAGCGGNSEDKDVKLTILDTEYIQEDYAICVAKENEPTRLL